MATSSPSTSLQWQHTSLHSITSPPFRTKLNLSFLSPPRTSQRRAAAVTVAFQRGDFDAFKKRVASGETWRDVWRSANDSFEQLVYDAKKAAERFDRRYDVSRKFGSAVEVASIRAREIDRDFEVSQKWRSFSIDFSRNLPRYRKLFSDFLDSPVGRGSSTLFFLWFALSGWLFRCLILATWVLPIAGPLLLNTLANKVVVKGACPSCKRNFIGNKNSMIQCTGCGNIVWQPQGGGFSEGNKNSTRSKSQPEFIDVDFEEK
ncbi:uncharacterized protein LOC141594429 [Silene latifolia]|uniref:uncharacterized protein LOC141594429 n=1 Tax=Silene latifolia TaxID=37657 RepID=UPI003D78624B